MQGRRIVPLMTLAGTLLAVHAIAAQPARYTRAATQSCLAQLPNAVTGLPPATPPVPALVFVHALTHDEVSAWGYASRPHTQLVVWDVDAKGRYEGIVLSFFANASAARASLKALGGKLAGNVVAVWAQKAVPSAHLRNAVFGCLQSATTAGPAQPAPAASLATFAGAWGGHTRGLSISARGRGDEETDDGCCTHVYRMTFQILSVRGTVTNGSAVYRVTAFRRYPEGPKGIRTGATGKLLLRDGIVTNTLTKTYFCSDPAWGTTGACGA